MPTNRIYVVALIASVALLAAGTGLAQDPAHMAGTPAPSAAASPAGDLYWTTGTVDGTGDRGSHASLAMHPVESQPYISYYDATAGDLLWARPVWPIFANCGPDNNWRCDTVDSNGDAGQYSSIAFCEEGDHDLGIAYHNASAGTLVYAHYDKFANPPWILTTIDGGFPAKAGLYASLKFDPSCRPRIAYQVSYALGDGRSLMYADYHGGGGGNCGGGDWNCNEIDSGDWLGAFASLDLDPDGIPAIAYYDLSADVLMYARRVSTGGNCGPDYAWRCDAIDTVSGDGQVVGQGPHVSLALGLEEGITAHIAYYDALDDTVNYATSSFSGTGNCGPGNTWLCQAIDPVGASKKPMGVSLALDANGPVIAYHDANGDGPGGNPVFKVAQPIARVGQASGNCGPTTGKPPVHTWQCDTVDDGLRGSLQHNVGQYPAVGLRGNGWPDAAYYDATSDDLLVAEQKADDDEPPSNPTDFESIPKRTKWSTDNTAWVSWSGADDGDGSGVQGYAYAWDEDPDTEIQTPFPMTTGTSATSEELADSSHWYFFIRTVDHAGNWAADTARYGPFYIDAHPPTNPDVTTTYDAGAWYLAGGSITFNWSGATDGTGSGVAGYGLDFDQSATTEPDGIAVCESLTLETTPDGAWYFHLNTVDQSGLRSDAVHLGPYLFDGTPPSPPTGLDSPTHPRGVWSNEPVVQVTWQAAGDGAGSGIAGYSYAWNESPDLHPDTTGSVATSPSLPDGKSRFTIRAKDKVGWWSEEEKLGNLLIDTAPPDSQATSPEKVFTEDTASFPVSWSGEDPACGSAYPHGSGISGYEIQYRFRRMDTTWSGWRPWHTSPGPGTAPFEGSRGSTYEFRSRATDAAGNQEPWPAAADSSTFVTLGADSGFRPRPDGYSFGNYGEANVDDYTIADMQQMLGDACVCALGSGPACTPRLTALFWYLAAHDGARGGHCTGLAATSSRFYDQVGPPPSDWQPGAASTFDLQKSNIRRHIMYYWVKQIPDPVGAAWSAARNDGINADLFALQQAFESGESTTLGMFWRTDDGKGGGHAVTPYGWEHRGDDLYWVWIYDNNCPDCEDRYVSIDIDPYATGPQWEYPAATWSGNSRDLAIIRTSPFDQPSVCPWTVPGSQSLAVATASGQVWKGGQGYLLITDGQGRRLGDDGEQPLNEIPGGADVTPPGGLGAAPYLIYSLPLDQEYQMRLFRPAVSETGMAAGLQVSPAISKTGKTDVTQFGPGYAVVVENAALEPGAEDQVTIANDGTKVTYQAGTFREVSLALILDRDNPGLRARRSGASPDASLGYRLRVSGADIGPGEAVSLSADGAQDKLAISHEQAGEGAYDLAITRSTEGGLLAFFHAAVVIAAGDSHYADYGGWDGTGAVTLDIDHGSDGSIDETVTLDNQGFRVYLPLVKRQHTR